MLFPNSSNWLGCGTVVKTTKYRDVYILLVVAILFSGFLLLNSLGVISFGTNTFKYSQGYALSILELNKQLASDLEIPADNARVRFAYENLNKAIVNATSTDEITNIILSEMSAFETIIREEADYYLTNWLEWIIFKDPNLSTLTAPAQVTVNILADNALSFDGGEFLDPSTFESIRAHFSSKTLGMQTVTIAIEINEGQVLTRVIEPFSKLFPLQHLQNQYKFLEQEYNKLRSLTGYSELTGPGLVISLMDAEDELLNSENNIIHDVDVQEVVNLLFESGATGISVGGRRLVVDTSIRCVGGPILVNYDPIPVKPLIIKAVGDGEAMKEHLESLFEFYRDVRDLQVEVTIESEIRLPGQSLR